MKKTIRILIATALTALTFTACSGGTTGTAAASGTTTPSTLPPATSAPATMPPVTTAIVTTPATQPATVPSTTSASGTGSGPVSTAFLKSAAWMSSLDSYRMTTTSTTQVMGQTTKSTSVMDFFPKESKYKMVSEAAGVKVESYMVDQKVYSKMPDGSWSYIKIDTEEIPPEESLKQISEIEFQDMFVFESTADGYRLKTRRPLTMDELTKLGTPGSDSSVPEGMEDLEDLEISYEMEMLLDQEYRNTETYMTMKMKMAEMSIDADIKMVYSDFNQVPDFELPSAAKDAKEMTIPAP